MRDAVVTISSFCMMAALCGRLTSGSRFMDAIRLVLGLEITRIMVEMAGRLLNGISGWR